MDQAAAIELQRDALARWLRAMAQASAGARLHERDGVLALAAPACPDRSVVNSAIYRDAAGLSGGLERLAAFYEEAGIAAWTVWVPEFDADAIAALEETGSALDATPAAMSLELDGLPPAEIGDLDWDERAEPAEVGAVNDLAFGLPPETGLARSLERRPEDSRLLRARVDGETASVLATIEGPTDLGFYFVATHPEHRGKGLCSRLMAAALGAARERGLRTAWLQATRMGEPVYAKLGFRRDFMLHMYERRRD